MKKYLGLFKNFFASAIEYRAYLIGLMILELISLGSTVILWFAVYSSNNEVGGYNFNDAILYYLAVPFIGSITQVFISDKLSKEIRQGILSNYLLKPYRVWLGAFVDVIANKINYLMLILPIYVGVVLFYFAKTGQGFNINNLLTGVLVALAAFLMHFVLDLMITWLSFWTHDIWCFVHVKNIIFSIFGGVSFPFDFLSAGLRSVFEFLPFKYLFYIPISYMLGKRAGIEVLLRDLGGMLAWTLLFILIGAFLWEKGLKKYESFGN